jgi:hypothetical protein
MTDPNFLVIGAQKAGTSWLARMLRQHPDIFIPKRKELHFFNVKANYARGIDWYRSQFEGWTTERRIGECTPTYLWVQDAPEAVQLPSKRQGCRRIEFEEYDYLNRNMAELAWKHYPNLQLIVSLRDPVERAVSGFLHSIRARRISPRSRIHDVGGEHGILGMGFYRGQLLEWMKFFPRERFLFLIYEDDIVQNKQRTLREIFRFLDVDPDFEVENQLVSINKRASNLYLYLNYYTPWIASGRLNHIPLVRDLDLPPIRVDEDDRAALYEIFRTEYEELEKLLGRSLNSWARASV